MAILSEYLRPTTVAEAERLLRERGPSAALLAGGTQVVADLERRLLPEVEAVIDIGRLGLGDLDSDGAALRAGAAVTLTDLTTHAAGASLANGLLARAARGEGPVNWRNAMTLGGIVAGAQTDSEVYAALLALGASVITATSTGPVPLESFETGGALITSVLIPLAGVRGGHARVARTPSDRPIVAAVAVASPERTRVALCGLGSRPLLDGAPYTPYADFKGSAEYRQAMAAVVKQRALAEAARG